MTLVLTPFLDKWLDVSPRLARPGLPARWTESLFLESLSGERRRTPGKSLLAGALWGIGCGLTQKTFALLPGVLAWSLIVTLLGKDAETKRLRSVALLNFIVGILLPIGLMALFFVAQGAGFTLCQHVPRHQSSLGN